MDNLIKSISFPPYIWIGLGAVITLLLVHRGFRGQADALFARMLGMRPKKGAQQDDDEDEE